MRTLSKDPKDRQASAEIFAGELLAALEAQGAQTSGVRASITNAAGIRVPESMRPPPMALPKPPSDRALPIVARSPSRSSCSRRPAACTSGCRVAAPPSRRRRPPRRPRRDPTARAPAARPPPTAAATSATTTRAARRVDARTRSRERRATAATAPIAAASTDKPAPADEADQGKHDRAARRSRHGTHTVPVVDDAAYGIFE